MKASLSSGTMSSLSCSLTFTGVPKLFLTLSPHQSFARVVVLPFPKPLPRYHSVVGGLEWLEAAMSLTEISTGYCKVRCHELKFVASALAKARDRRQK